MKIIYSILFILCVVGAASAQKKHKNWRFINLPDYHYAEGFSVKGPERDKRIAEQTKRVRQIKAQYGGDLITIPGDAVSGHWYRDQYVKRIRSKPEYKNFTTEQVILEASRLSYGGLWKIVHDGGYENLLMAVGDHEIGDNPWRKGVEVSKHIGTFRKGFANTFTLDAKGKSRFDQKIGKAEPRPLGTIYEHSSNAYQHKNVLFITLDIFRFDGKDIILGDQGVVSGDINGKHLEWFESVLSEAQNIRSIKHIVVQSHLPIIYPVRKYASSGMLVDKNESEKFLNVLRKYKVDLYLAGEVHMNSLTKDPKSDLIQFVGRGNNFSNITVIEVEDDKLSLVTYQQNGDKLGSALIDKSGAKTKIETDGLLKAIHPKGLQIHWSFDEQKDKSNYKNSIEGSFPKKGKHNPLMTENEDMIAYLNDGGFNYDYSLLGSNTEEVNGVIGNALKLNQSTKLFLLPIGPMENSYERTVACWIKTTSTGRQLILNSGSYWTKKGQFFNLGLNGGNFEVALRPEIVSTTRGLKLNDGKWHHIAVVVPYDEAKLKDLKLYVDGDLIDDKENTRPEVKVNTSQANWMSIAMQSKTYRTDLTQSMGLKDYVGLLDDFSIWTRALSHKDVQTLYAEGLKGTNALDMEKELLQVEGSGH